MPAYLRTLPRLGLSQLAVVTFVVSACAAAQVDTTDTGTGVTVAGAGTSGGSGGTGNSTSAGASTLPVAGTSVVGTAGTGVASSGGHVGTGGQATTTAGAATTTTAGAATTTGGSTSTSTCPQYAGTTAAASVIFMDGFGKSTTGTWSGYGYTYTYGTGVTVMPGTTGMGCFTGPKFCANGSVPAADTAGAGIGWNIAQVKGSSTTSAVAITGSVVVKTAGATAGMRIQLSESATVSYCYTLTAADVPTATIPAASFKKNCWATDSTAVAYAGTMISAIQVVVPGAAAAAKTFDFCVTDVEPG